jgi:hypothetical protein
VVPPIVLLAAVGVVMGAFGGALAIVALEVLA